MLSERFVVTQLVSPNVVFVGIFAAADNASRRAAEVFTKIYEHTQGQPAISHKEAPEKLKAYFAEILPEYDRDRVHVSDMKKVFSWFNTLVGAGFTEFKLPAEQEA